MKLQLVINSLKLTLLSIICLAALIYFPILINHEHRLDKLEEPEAIAVSETLPELYDHYTDFSLDEWIDYCATERNIDPDLVRAIIEQESGGYPNAVSETDDYGLMQINAEYWTYYFYLYPEHIDEWRLPDDPFNAYSNIYAGCNALLDWKEICQDLGHEKPIDYINCYNRGYDYFDSHNTNYSDAVLNRLLKNSTIGD